MKVIHTHPVVRWPLMVSCSPPLCSWPHGKLTCHFVLADLAAANLLSGGWFIFIFLGGGIAVTACLTVSLGVNLRFAVSFRSRFSAWIRVRVKVRVKARATGRVTIQHFTLSQPINEACESGHHPDRRDFIAGVLFGHRWAPHQPKPPQPHNHPDSDTHLFLTQLDDSR